MSTREILSELSHLSSAELREIEQRIAAVRSSLNEASIESAAPLRPQRIAGRLLLVGSSTVPQSLVDAILADFP
jgi:hypothetical protein